MLACRRDPGGGRLRTLLLVCQAKRLAARACIAVVLIAAPACTIVNDISVCDRAAPSEQEANVSGDGSQQVTSEQALAAWPSGRGYVVFTSGDEGSTRREIRGAFLRPDGSSVPVCGSDGEVTIASATGPGPALLAPPARDEETGLVVFVDELAGMRRVFAQYLRADGCPVGAPVAVGEEEPGEHVQDSPAVVGLGDNLFVVVWTVVRLLGPSSYAIYIRARVLRGDSGIGHLRFDGTALSPAGDPIDLIPIAASPRGMAAARLGPDRIGLVWYEVVNVSSIMTVLAIFDDDLREIVKRQAGVNDRGTFALPDPPEASLAYDGGQVLVTWLEQDESGGTSVMGRFFDRDGQALRAPDSPDGEAFRVEPTAVLSQRSPDVTGLHDGGFLLLWGEEASDGNGSGIRGALFGSDGERRFANPACGSAALDLNAIVQGDQERPSVIQLVDGSVLATWTDHSREGRDVSGSAVRVRAYRERELLPLE